MPFGFSSTPPFCFSSIYARSPASPCPSYIPKGCRWRGSGNRRRWQKLNPNLILNQDLTGTEQPLNFLCIFSDRTGTGWRIYKSNRRSYLLNATEAPNFNETHSRLNILSIPRFARIWKKVPIYAGCRTLYRMTNKKGVIFTHREGRETPPKQGGRIQRRQTTDTAGAG